MKTVSINNLYSKLRGYAFAAVPAVALMLSSHNAEADTSDDASLRQSENSKHPVALAYEHHTHTSKQTLASRRPVGSAHTPSNDATSLLYKSLLVKAGVPENGDNSAHSDVVVSMDPQATGAYLQPRHYFSPSSNPHFPWFKLSDFGGRGPITFDGRGNVETVALNFPHNAEHVNGVSFNAATGVNIAWVDAHAKSPATVLKKAQQESEYILASAAYYYHALHERTVPTEAMLEKTLRPFIQASWTIEQGTAPGAPLKRDALVVFPRSHDLVPANVAQTGTAPQPQPSIEAHSSPDQQRISPALLGRLQVDIGIALGRLADTYKDVRYGWGSRDLNNLTIDCSGMVSEFAPIEMAAVNKRVGGEVYDVKKIHSMLRDWSADEQVKNIAHLTGVSISDSDIRAGHVTPGMIIGSSNRGDDYYHHVVMVVLDANGNLAIAESNNAYWHDRSRHLVSENGISLISFDDYLYRTRHQDLCATNPFGLCRPGAAQLISAYNGNDAPFNVTVQNAAFVPANDASAAVTSQNASYTYDPSDNASVTVLAAALASPEQDVPLVPVSDSLPLPGGAASAVPPQDAPPPVEVLPPIPKNTNAAPVAPQPVVPSQSTEVHHSGVAAAASAPEQADAEPKLASIAVADTDPLPTQATTDNLPTQAVTVPADVAPASVDGKELLPSKEWVIFTDKHGRTHASLVPGSHGHNFNNIVNEKHNRIVAQAVKIINRTRMTANVVITDGDYSQPSIEHFRAAAHGQRLTGYDRQVALNQFRTWLDGDGQEQLRGDVASIEQQIAGSSAAQVVKESPLPESPLPALKTQDATTTIRTPPGTTMTVVVSPPVAVTPPVPPVQSKVTSVQTEEKTVVTKPDSVTSTTTISSTTVSSPAHGNPWIPVILASAAIAVVAVGYEYMTRTAHGRNVAKDIRAAYIGARNAFNHAQKEPEKLQDKPVLAPATKPKPSAPPLPPQRPNPHPSFRIRTIYGDRVITF